MKTTVLFPFLLSVCLGEVYAQVNYVQPGVGTPGVAMPGRYADAVATPVGVSTYSQPIDPATFRTSYAIHVSDTKTTHLIFPHEIKYADLGSKDIYGEAVEKAGNVFRIKSMNRSFLGTSLTVITADGKLYSFRVQYDQDPLVLTYDLSRLSQTPEVPKSAKVASGSVAKLADKLNTLGTQALESRRRIRHVGYQTQGMKLYLKNILYTEDVMFLVLGLDNDSKLDYNPDFMRLYVAQLKRAGESSASQEVIVEPIKIFDDGQPTIPHRQTVTRVLAINRMTLEKDRRLMVQVNEKEGARLLTLPIGPEELASAKPL
ncbi:conjugative transposon protein TraN [Nibrella viscosa]|uniref:Conjugative transposon protein TraN n=1 Tax=Nibrella viscosa TaxID=1084524 RepID=A0ABP8KYT6_9BACT